MDVRKIGVLIHFSRYNNSMLSRYILPQSRICRETKRILLEEVLAYQNSCRNIYVNGNFRCIVSARRTSKGQNIDIFRYDYIFAILENALVHHTIGGEKSLKIGSGHATISIYDVVAGNAAIRGRDSKKMH
jgi:hypothetical protein